jgi:hypothetical protein
MASKVLNRLEKSNNFINYKKNAYDDQIVTKKQYTLVYVIKKGYFNLVRSLLKSGSEPNHVELKDDLQMRSPLILSTFIKDEKWSFNVAQNLLEYGASLKITDVNRLNGLHYCCAFGNEKLLNLFLNSLDFDITNSLDMNGNSCMHYALRSHSLSCVQLLLENYYTNLKDPDLILKKINQKNIFGLKLSDLEEEIDEIKRSNSFYFTNKIYSGNNKLSECKNAVLDFLTFLSTKFYNSKEKTPNNLAKNDTNYSFFQTQLSQSNFLQVNTNGFEVSQEFNSDTLVDSSYQKTLNLDSERTGSKLSRKFLENKSNLSHFNHFVLVKKKTKKPMNQLKNNAKSREKLKIFKLDEEKINDQSFYRKEYEKEFKSSYDRETSKALMNKSFLISWNDYLKNSIDFNSLFYNEKYMVESAKLFTRKKGEIDGKKRAKNTSVLLTEIPKTASCSKNVQNHNFYDDLEDEEEDDYQTLIIEQLINTRLDNLEYLKNFNWRREMPEFYKDFESFMTVNYRHTIHPHLTSEKLNTKAIQEYRNRLRHSARLHRRKSVNFKEKNPTYYKSQKGNFSFKKSKSIHSLIHSKKAVNPSIEIDSSLSSSDESSNYTTTNDSVSISNSSKKAFKF